MNVLRAWNPPPTVTATQSYSFVIRDMFFDKLVAAPFFAGFIARKSKALQLAQNTLPYLGVYFIREEMSPDGDFDTGEIRFTHFLKIGFSVVIINNDPVACEAKLDQAFWAIMNTLWRDPYLMNVIDTRVYPGAVGNPDNTRIEGVTKGTRGHVFGNAGLNNELPVGEMQYEATVRYVANYPPVITDDLLLISTRTGVKADDTANEMAQRQQTGADYALEGDPSSDPLKED